MPLPQAAHASPHVVLVGPTGAGKTTVGRRLAGFLQRPFFDVDEELEKATGVSVNLIFDIEKEDGFRRRESRMLQQLLAQPAAVIATGAGVVVRKENRQLLRQANVLVVYLETSVKRQLERLQYDKRRPLLQVPDRELRLREMANIRNPLYESISDLVIYTNTDSPYRMARATYRQIKPALSAWRAKQASDNDDKQVD